MLHYNLATYFWYADEHMDLTLHERAMLTLSDVFNGCAGEDPDEETIFEWLDVHAPHYGVVVRPRMETDWTAHWWPDHSPTDVACVDIWIIFNATDEAMLAKLARGIPIRDCEE